MSIYAKFSLYVRILKIVQKCPAPNEQGLGFIALINIKNSEKNINIICFYI